MDVRPGAEDTFLVTSATGRCIAIFDDRSLVDEWLDQHRDNGVNYRLFRRSTDTVEIRPPAGAESGEREQR